MSSSDPHIGLELAGYLIERVVGRGGMGVVYLATDMRLGRTVALKLLSPELAGDDRFRERFVRESRLAASLEHPHIVPIHAAGEADGALYLAMRYIDGTDLRMLIGEHGALEPARAALILRQVAGALDAAHASGLVHRDVKPGNVLIGELSSADHAYLADFGLTKQASSITGLTVTGQLVGTLDYLAPEVIEGRPADARADQYALACLAYEVLAGAPPFRRDTEAATLWAHMRDQPAALPAGIDGSQQLRGVLTRALAKRPEDRYENCEAFARDFAVSVPGAESDRPRITRRLVALVSVALILAVVVTAVATTLLTDSSIAPVRHAPSDSLVAFDPTSGRVVGDPIKVGRVPTGVVASGDAIWVANSGSQSLTWVDSKTRRVVRTVKLDVTPTGIAAAAEGGVWVAAGLVRQVLRITPNGSGGYDREVYRVPGCCAGPSVIASTAGRVFLGDMQGVHIVDPDIGRVSAALPTSDGTRVPATGGVGAGANEHVVFTDGWAHTLTVNAALDVPTVTVVFQPGEPTGVATGDGYEWVALRRLDQVRLQQGGEHQTGTPTYHVAGGPIQIAFAKQRAWVASQMTGSVTPVTTTTQRIGRAIKIGPRLGGITAGGGLLWVTVQSANAAEDASGTILFSPEGGLDVEGFASIPARGGEITSAQGGPGGMAAPSPDGQQITFSGEIGQNSAEGGVSNHISVGTLGETQSHVIASGQVTAPRWSPKGDEIAYWSDLTHGSAVTLTPPDGGSGHVIYTSPMPLGPLSQLDWSPDAENLVIQRPADGPGLLDVIDKTGHHQRPLTLFPAYSPRWSPDGTRIAYVGQVNGPGIYVSGLDGQTYLVLATPNILDLVTNTATLHWSPDGRQLTYAGHTASAGSALGGEDIWIVNADGTGATRITDTGGTGATLPVWLPHP